MKVIIVGGGLGGLSTAIACRRQDFDVTVFEQAAEFQRIGDSIGLGSNAARLFYRWGVGERLAKISSKAKGIQIHNFDSSDITLGLDDGPSKAEAQYGCRSLIGHRGDYHMILYEFAKESGVKIHLGSFVKSYDPKKPSVILANGDEITSDVVICSDGAKSNARSILGVPQQALSSGYAIYRSFMPGSLLKSDPIAGKFIAGGDSIHLFIGPDCHGFVTVLRDGDEINAVLTHKDDADINENWSEPGDKEDVLRLVEGWDPAFRRVWEKMPSLIDWKLVYRPCLDKWVTDSGLITLMGDAAHPFLPTSTQGASQAIEDGATLAICLAKAGKENIPLALRTFFEIRHDYVAAAQATGISQRDLWHNMHDKENRLFNQEFDLAASSQQNYYLWENDAEKVAEEKWEKISRDVQQNLELDVKRNKFGSAAVVNSVSA